MLRLLQCKVRRIQPVTRRLPLCVQRRMIDRERNRARVSVVVFDPGAPIRLAPNAVRRGLPRQRRPHRTVRLRKRSVRRIHIRQSLLDRSVALKRHLHAARKIHLHRFRRCRPRKKPDRSRESQCAYQPFRKKTPCIQNHFLLVRNGCTRTAGCSKAVRINCMNCIDRFYHCISCDRLFQINLSLGTEKSRP